MGSERRLGCQMGLCVKGQGELAKHKAHLALEFEPNFTVHEIRLKFERQVRFVFRQFPLTFHTQAHLAAEAALAAHAQGRFWEMHDLLFAHQKALERKDIESYAASAGLNMDAFGKT